MSFFIKAGYIENPGPVYFIDDVTTTRGIVFQPDVYTFAELLCDLTGVGRIIDVGCGRADKLAAMQTRQPLWGWHGIDYGPNIEHCRTTYDWGHWEEQDFEQEFDLVGEDSIIICSDVLEHLVDPRPLLRTLYKANATEIVISTPERDVQHGYDHMGPSPNRCHVREWNAAELKLLLESENLHVDHIGLTRGNDQSYAMGTILAVCH